MSLILDALRRSDDRRAQLDSHRSRVRPVRPIPERKDPWRRWLMVALAFNILLSVWLLWPGDEATEEPADSTAAAMDTPHEAPVQTQIEPVIETAVVEDADRPLFPEATRPAETREAPTADPTPEQAPDALSSTPTPETQTAPVPASTSVADAASAPANLPELAELSLEVRQQLPTLSLQVHVYDQDPARRFVMIDSRRLQEGDETRSGQRVVRIYQDGVVLEHRGLRFLLPRR